MVAVLALGAAFALGEGLAVFLIDLVSVFLATMRWLLNKGTFIH